MSWMRILTPAALLLLGCTEEDPIDPIPIPDELDQAFVYGTVCMADQAAPDETVPIRLDYCLYRCLKLASHKFFFTFRAGASNEINLLYLGNYTRLDSETDCDGRYIDLEEPAPEDCYSESAEFSIAAPSIAADYSVRLPQFDQMTSAAAAEAIDADEGTTFLNDEMDHQRHPEREFPLLVEDGATLGDEQCHDIPFPMVAE